MELLKFLWIIRSQSSSNDFTDVDKLSNLFMNFKIKVEELSNRKESQKNDSSFDENHFLKHCADLWKQLDNYKRKIEGMKNTGDQSSIKENVLEDLKTMAVS